MFYLYIVSVRTENVDGGAAQRTVENGVFARRNGNYIILVFQVNLRKNCNIYIIVIQFYEKRRILSTYFNGAFLYNYAH